LIPIVAGVDALFGPSAEFSIGLKIFAVVMMLVGFVMGSSALIATRLEDQALQEKLEGYRDYAQRVRYRLIPGVW